MIILAIETSCDDTCIAIIKTEGKKKPKFKILSNLVSSQVKLHAKYGGVYPTLAKREHQKNLPLILKKALRQAQGKPIDLIAVTIGHGLDPCLWAGLNFAKDLAGKFKKPLIPVNHIEAHILANLIDRDEISTKFLAVALVVSGGHTGLFLMKGIGQYKLIGETRDDAAGECFDKAARILGLGYPGGPIISKLAIDQGSASIKLPRPMIHQKNYDFSFSGLKTAILYDFKSRSPKVRKSKKYIKEMAAEIQQAIIDVLIKKTIKAARDYRAKAIILGGGVVANNELRKQFRKQDVKVYAPDIKYCTDNAAMIGVTAYFQYLQGRYPKNWQRIAVSANLRI